LREANKEEMQEIAKLREANSRFASENASMAQVKEALNDDIVALQKWHKTFAREIESLKTQIAQERTKSDEAKKRVLRGRESSRKQLAQEATQNSCLAGEKLSLAAAKEAQKKKIDPLRKQREKLAPEPGTLTEDYVRGRAEIDWREINSELSGKFSSKKCAAARSRSFRSIHLRQTDNNHWGSNHVILSAFEVFGVVAGLQQTVQANRFSPSLGNQSLLEVSTNVVLRGPSCSRAEGGTKTFKPLSAVRTPENAFQPSEKPVGRLAVHVK
jgi:hypothetical protein